MPWLRPLSLGLLVMLAYYVAGRVGLAMHAYVNTSITLIWLPAGIAVAALLRLGGRYWPAIYGGA
ncbi:MAG: MASE1 domain-containing protein, partial [Magnetococcales bacterium]|nr:MASE1 domain-containing protein [Magnetococcales bacterium]